MATLVFCAFHSNINARLFAKPLEKNSDYKVINFNLELYELLDPLENFAAIKAAVDKYNTEHPASAHNDGFMNVINSSTFNRARELYADFILASCELNIESKPDGDWDIIIAGDVNLFERNGNSDAFAVIAQRINNHSGAGNFCLEINPIDNGKLRDPTSQSSSPDIPVFNVGFLPASANFSCEVNAYKYHYAPFAASQISKSTQPTLYFTKQLAHRVPTPRFTQKHFDFQSEAYPTYLSDMGSPSLSASAANSTSFSAASETPVIVNDSDPEVALDSSTPPSVASAESIQTASTAGFMSHGSSSPNVLHSLAAIYTLAAATTPNRKRKSVEPEEDSNPDEKLSSTDNSNKKQKLFVDPSQSTVEASPHPSFRKK
jgi:hypothetical protein